MTQKTDTTSIRAKARPQTETTVKGGSIKREADTGRFTEVRTANGVYKPQSSSVSTLMQTTSKRSDALKRLADR